MFYSYIVTCSVADFRIGGNVAGLRGRVDVGHEHPTVPRDLGPHPAGPEGPQVSGRLTRCTVHQGSVQEMSGGYHLPKRKIIKKKIS